ncbi:MAG: hypothetical protein Q4F43_10495 [Eubacteriales bacterium]|nr:hypothetical protein [Eubacteriales bacterium]
MAFVVFVTTYALVLPAITIDEQTAASEPGLEVSYVNEEGSQAEAAAEEMLADADAAEDAAVEALANETFEEPAPIEEAVVEEPAVEPEPAPAEEPQQMLEAEPVIENEPTQQESVTATQESFEPEESVAAPQQEAPQEEQVVSGSYAATPDNTNENDNAAVTETVIAGQTENSQPAQADAETVEQSEGAAVQETPAQDTNAVYANEAEYLAATYPARRFEAKVEETTQRMIIQGTEVDPDAEPVMSLKARELAERAKQAAQTGDEPYTEDILKALYVTVEAPAGALPKDTFMAIEALHDEDVLQAFMDAAEGEALFRQGRRHHLLR